VAKNPFKVTPKTTEKVHNLKKVALNLKKVGQNLDKVTPKQEKRPNILKKWP
jgi:hypothetical protein